MANISERDLELPVLEFPKIFQKVVNDKSIISLGPGEPDFSAPKELLDYAKKVIDKATHYPDPHGITELREAIVKKVRKENKIKTHPNNVLVGCGSQALLFASLLTTLDPTEQVIVPSPGYLGYIPPIELVSGVPVFLRLDEKDRFEFNPDRVRKLITPKTKALIVNSPSNPTGTVLSKRILEELADIAVEKDIYLFSDEAYEKILYDNVKHISPASLNGMEDHVVTFQSFSKSFAMCGFRVGYAIGPNHFIEEMTKVNHYITLTAPHISSLVAAQALKINLNNYVNNMVKEYKRRRDFLVKRLNQLDMPTPIPKGAFYTFSNITEHDKSASKFAKRLIEKAKVAVIPGTEFGPYGEGYVRCSFATDYDKIVEAMDRVERELRKR